MALIKECLDSACIHYRMVEGGKLVQQRKAKCDRNWVPPEGFDEKFDTMMRQTKEINNASPGMFDLSSKVGEELILAEEVQATALPPAKEQTKKQKIADLETQLKQLKKK